jgi:hypothetical protein
MIETQPGATHRVALVSVVSGAEYVRYARELHRSAEGRFMSDSGTAPLLLILEGRPGWPMATMHRYHVILEEAHCLAEATHVFHIDADMRFVGNVGSEILAPLVATAHPGYVGRRGTFEGRPESAAYVGPDEGTTYFCGGFVGGEREEFLRLATAIRDGVNADGTRDLIAVWHDESHLNRYLAGRPPDVTLSPSYCYPEDDRYYRRKVWPERYEPKIVALRKRRLLQWRHRFAARAHRA